MAYSIIIDRSRFETLEGFFTEMDRLPRIRWMPSMTCCGAAFGVHEYGELLHIRWMNAEKSRRDLLGGCHPFNRRDLGKNWPRRSSTEGRP